MAKEQAIPDIWSKFGAAFARFDNDGPSQQGAEAIVKQANNALPFSKASGILDVGCGTGHIIAALFQSHGQDVPQRCPIIASDLSPGMVELLRKKVDQNPSWKRITTAVYDAMNLAQVESDSMSHVLSGFTFHFLPKQALTEAYRVLQLNGVFVMTAIPQAGWRDVLVNTLKEVRPEIVLPDITPHWKTPEGNKGELEAAGFKNVETYTTPLHLPYDDAKEIVSFLSSSMPFLGAITKTMTSDELDKWKQIMVDTVRKDYPDRKIQGIAIIALGRK